jgi:predicted RNA-binding protein
MERGNQRTEVMREVIRMAPVERGIRLQTFFEEPVVVTGRITEIDIIKHTVNLVPIEGEKDQS